MSSIRTTPTGVISSPDQIARYQLMTVRAMLKLEKLGMRHSSGPIRPMWAPKLGLRPRDSYDKFINALTERIEA